MGEQIRSSTQGSSGEQAQAMASQDDAAQLESHRAFVRRIHEQLQRVYAYGGLCALCAPALVWVGAWVAGALWTALPWVSSVMVALLALYGVRRAGQRATAQATARVLAYCQVNGLDASRLRAHYAEDRTYRFFLILPLEADDASRPR